MISSITSEPLVSTSFVMALKNLMHNRRNHRILSESPYFLDFVKYYQLTMSNMHCARWISQDKYFFCRFRRRNKKMIGGNNLRPKFSPSSFSACNVLFLDTKDLISIRMHGKSLETIYEFDWWKSLFNKTSITKGVDLSVAFTGSQTE